MNGEKIKTFSEYKKAFINRASLIDRVKPYMGKDIIKVFTGLTKGWEKLFNFSGSAS